MKTFFQDNFLNKKVMSKMMKQVEKEQLSKVIDEINYLHELQNEYISRYHLMPSIKENIKIILDLTNYFVFLFIDICIP